MKKYVAVVLGQRYIPVVAYILIVFGLFFTVLRPQTNAILFGDDFIHMVYYERTFVRSSLAGGQLPLWNPYLYGGMPFMEHPQLTFWYPVNILFLLLPLASAFPVHLAIHICIAMISMYWLMRHWVDGLPAWFSGLAFGLSTFFWYRIPAGHVDVIAAAAWAPLVFGLSYEVCNIGPRFITKRHIPLILYTAGAIAVQIFSGYKTMVILTAEAVGVMCLFASVARRSLRPFLLWHSPGLSEGCLRLLNLSEIGSTWGKAYCI